MGNLLAKPYPAPWGGFRRRKSENVRFSGILPAWASSIPTTAHTTLIYHIVFQIKYRKALLEPHIDQAILEIAKEIEERYDITFEKIGTDGNHIHLLCSFHTKYSGVQVVGMFKNIMARELFRRFPELRKKLCGGEFWSDGYYLATVSEKGNWKTVERYVANQGKTMQKPGQLTLWS